jgi:hypothetical protein
MRVRGYAEIVAGRSNAPINNLGSLDFGIFPTCGFCAVGFRTKLWLVFTPIFHHLFNRFFCKHWVHALFDELIFDIFGELFLTLPIRQCQKVKPFLSRIAELDKAPWDRRIYAAVFDRLIQQCLICAIVSLLFTALRCPAPASPKNIHIGNKEAGPRVAAIVSVVETCRRLKIPIRDYLCSILPGLANFAVNRIAELTPAAWLARN